MIYLSKESVEAGDILSLSIEVMIGGWHLGQNDKYKREYMRGPCVIEYGY